MPKIKKSNKDRQLPKVRWWEVLVLSAVLLIPGIWLLRQNNLKMIELRDEVVKIDQETGDINEIEPALEELRAHILTHMNSSMAQPLELVGSFNKAVEVAREKAEASSDVNSSIYSKAQTKCEDASIPLTARAQCIQDYVVTNAKPGEPITELEIPPKEQFVYNFVSPSFSADAAGIVILTSVVLAIISVAMLATQVILPAVAAKINSDPLE